MCRGRRRLLLRFQRERQAVLLLGPQLAGQPRQGSQGAIRQQLWHRLRLLWYWLRQHHLWRYLRLRWSNSCSHTAWSDHCSSPAWSNSGSRTAWTDHCSSPAWSNSGSRTALIRPLHQSRLVKPRQPYRLVRPRRLPQPVRPVQLVVMTKACSRPTRPRANHGRPPWFPHGLERRKPSFRLQGRKPLLDTSASTLHRNAGESAMGAGALGRQAFSDASGMVAWNGTLWGIAHLLPPPIIHRSLCKYVPR